MSAPRLLKEPATCWTMPASGPEWLREPGEGEFSGTLRKVGGWGGGGGVVDSPQDFPSLWARSMQHAQLSLLLTSLSTVLILLFFYSTLSLTVIMCLTCSVTNEVMLALRQMESQQAQRRAVRDFWCIYFINLNKNSILHIYVVYYGLFFFFKLGLERSL